MPIAAAGADVLVKETAAIDQMMPLESLAAI
jgi:hypothetical protein